jgi:hypothetical protein
MFKRLRARHGGPEARRDPRGRPPRGPAPPGFHTAPIPGVAPAAGHGTGNRDRCPIIKGVARPTPPTAPSGRAARGRKRDRDARFGRQSGSRRSTTRRSPTSSAGVASWVFARPRWCLGSAHPPAGRTGDDESAVPARERASQHRELRDRPQSSAAGASAVFAASRWCLGSAHLPAGRTGDDESAVPARERASRHRELRDRPQSSRASASPERLGRPHPWESGRP